MGFVELEVSPTEYDTFKGIKLWVDDVRPVPIGQGYRYWARSVNEAKEIINFCERFEKRRMNIARKCFENREYTLRSQVYDSLKYASIILIDVDHDAGDYAKDGGDYIKLLDWLEETGRNYPIRIHTQNVVGAQNMRRIINKNNWKEVK